VLGADGQAPNGWGQDPRLGTLTLATDAGVDTCSVAGPAGNYLAYYARLRDCLQGRGIAPPVTTSQVHMAMQLLSLGEQSAREGRFVPVPQTLKPL